MSSNSKFEAIKTKIYLDLLGLSEVVINAVNKLRKSKQQPQCMNGIATLITGGNAGIGRATAEELVKRGSDVVIACRNRATADETATALGQLCPYFDTLGTVEVVDVDLASLNSVRSLISNLSSRQKAFDCIITNSGIMTPPNRIETEDGFESQFQVNFLGHFLLVHELLKNKKPEYERTGQKPPRCVFLSSMAHFGATLEKDLDGDLQAKTRYDPFKCYANSKLCQLLAAKELNRRMNDGSGEFPSGGVAVACHPGIVDTALARQYFKDRVPKLLLPIAAPILDTIFFPGFLKTPKAAAECVLYAATAPAEEVGGKYIQECAVARSSKASEDVVLARRLWKKGKELAGLED
jgi:NAD(P)-dependent dehydrogenase (short-subunit alcohol dehydrogenase family)